MVTIAAVLIGALFAFGWGAVGNWRLGERRAAIAYVTMCGVSALAVAGAIYLLATTDNPWAWVGFPMACRWRLHGC